MPLTKDDLKGIKDIVDGSIEKSEDRVKKYVDGSIEKSSQGLKEYVDGSIEKSEKKIIEVISQEISDLAEINQVVINEVDKIRDLDKRLKRVEHRLRMAKA